MHDNKIINDSNYKTMNEFLEQAITGLQTLPSNRGVIASEKDMKALGEVRKAIHSLEEAISNVREREKQPNVDNPYVPEYQFYKNLDALGQMKVLVIDVMTLDESHKTQLDDLEQTLEVVLKQHQPIDDVSIASDKAKHLKTKETIHCTPNVYGENPDLIEHACKHDRNDPDVMINVIAKHPNYAIYMGDALKSDDDFAMHVVKNYGVEPNDVSIFSSASDAMKNIQDLKPNETIQCMPKVYGEHPPLIEFACEHDRNDQGVMINVIAKHPNYAKHMGNELKYDYDFAMFVVEKYDVDPHHFAPEIANHWEVKLARKGIDGMASTLLGGMAVGALVGGGLFAAQFFNLVSIVPFTDPILLASIFIGGGIVVGLMVGALVLSGLQARDERMPTPVTVKHDAKSSSDIGHVTSNEKRAVSDILIDFQAQTQNKSELLGDIRAAKEKRGGPKPR